MATGVGWGKMWIASLDGPTSKTLLQTQKVRRYLLQKPSYNPFCSKFCCHGNEGQLGVKINGTVKLADPDNPTLEPNRKCIG